jgi:hypothetical protein
MRMASVAIAHVVAAPDGTVVDTPVSGPAGGASYHFDWGRGGALDHRTPERQVTADSATHSVTELIDGLTPGAGCSPAACAATRRRPALSRHRAPGRRGTGAQPPPHRAEALTRRTAIRRSVAAGA